MSLWMQSIQTKENALSTRLNFPNGKNLPRGLLKQIVKSRPGTKLINPTFQGKYQILVDEKMVKQAKLALN